MGFTEEGNSGPSDADENENQWEAAASVFASLEPESDEGGRPANGRLPATEFPTPTTPSLPGATMTTPNPSP